MKQLPEWMRDYEDEVIAAAEVARIRAGQWDPSSLRDLPEKDALFWLEAAAFWKDTFDLSWRGEVRK